MSAPCFGSKLSIYIFVFCYLETSFSIRSLLLWTKNDSTTRSYSLLLSQNTIFYAHASGRFEASKDYFLSPLQQLFQNLLRANSICHCFKLIGAFFSARNAS